MVGHNDLIGAVGDQGSGFALDAGTGQNGHHLLAQRVSQLPGLAHQLKGDLLDLAVALLAENENVLIHDSQYLHQMMCLAASFSTMAATASSAVRSFRTSPAPLASLVVETAT